MRSEVHGYPRSEAPPPGDPYFLLESTCSDHLNSPSNLPQVRRLGARTIVGRVHYRGSARMSASPSAASYVDRLNARWFRQLCASHDSKDWSERQVSEEADVGGTEAMRQQRTSASFQFFDAPSTRGPKHSRPDLADTGPAACEREAEKGGLSHARKECSCLGLSLRSVRTA